MLVCRLELLMNQAQPQLLVDHVRWNQFFFCRPFRFRCAYFCEFDRVHNDCDACLHHEMAQKTFFTHEIVTSGRSRLKWPTKTFHFSFNFSLLGSLFCVRCVEPRRVFFSGCWEDWNEFTCVWSPQHISSVHANFPLFARFVFISHRVPHSEIWWWWMLAMEREKESLENKNHLLYAIESDRLTLIYAQAHKRMQSDEESSWFASLCYDFIRSVWVSSFHYDWWMVTSRTLKIVIWLRISHSAGYHQLNFNWNWSDFFFTQLEFSFIHNISTVCKLWRSLKFAIFSSDSWPVKREIEINFWSTINNNDDVFMRRVYLSLVIELKISSCFFLSGHHVDK